MADEWLFKLEGTEQSLEKVYLINDKLNMHVGDIAAAREIRDMAKDLAPVRTGHLRDSIRAWETVDGATVTAGGVSNAGSLLDGDITPVDVDYAPYVEFGTYKMAAQPYMRPAVQLEKLTETIRDAIQNLLGGLL